MSIINIIKNGTNLDWAKKRNGPTPYLFCWFPKQKALYVGWVFFRRVFICAFLSLYTLAFYFEYVYGYKCHSFRIWWLMWTFFSFLSIHRKKNFNLEFTKEKPLPTCPSPPSTLQCLPVSPLYERSASPWKRNDMCYVTRRNEIIAVI